MRPYATNQKETGKNRGPSAASNMDDSSYEEAEFSGPTRMRQKAK